MSPSPGCHAALPAFGNGPGKAGAGRGKLGRQLWGETKLHLVRAGSRGQGWSKVPGRCGLGTG